MLGDKPDFPYDASYRRDHSVWGVSASAPVVRACNLLELSNAHAVDVGAGQGRHANYIAEHGATVWALEPSSAAADLRPESKPGVTWVTTRIEDWQPIVPLDLIVAYGVLHCLPTELAVKAQVARMKRWLAAGGILVICSFNSRDHENFDIAHPGFRPSLLSHDDYVSLVSDLEIIEASDTDLTETHADLGVEHRHSMTRLIARTPA